jgi:transposase-like protein
MGKRRVGRYPRAFRQMAVDRLRRCENVVVLSEELGVHRRLLYKWRKQLEPADGSVQAPPDLREFTLRKEINQLKRLLGEKTQPLASDCVGLQKGANRQLGGRDR